MSDESSKIGRISLWVFAAIGAIASILTISDLVTQPKPDLRGEVYVNRNMLPSSFKRALAFDESDNLYDFALKLSVGLDCPTESSEKVAEPRQDINDSLIHDCRHLDEIMNLSRAVESQKHYDVTHLDVKLHNEGLRVAQGIRLKSDDFVEVDVSASGEKHIKIEVDEAGNYILPDLNPGDELSLQILKKDTGFNYDPYDASKFAPKINYREGSAYFDVFIHDYANELDRLSKNSIGDWIVIVFVAIFASFIIVLVVILVGSVAVGIYRGAPMRDWLKSFDEPKSVEHASDNEPATPPNF